jgi:hypothetical protein
MSDTKDSVEKPPLIGIDDCGSIFIMTPDGSSACYFKGQWRPGIIFEGRDMMNFVPITEPTEVEKLMKEAGWALAAFLEKHKT